jgi:hypothetical protein
MRVASMGSLAADTNMPRRRECVMIYVAELLESESNIGTHTAAHMFNDCRNCMERGGYRRVSALSITLCHILRDMRGCSNMCNQQAQGVYQR